MLIQQAGNTNPRNRDHVPDAIGKLLVLISQGVKLEEYRDYQKVLAQGYAELSWSVTTADDDGMPVIRVRCAGAGCQQKFGEYMSCSKGLAHERVFNCQHHLGVRAPQDVADLYQSRWNSYAAKTRREEKPKFYKKKQ